MPRAAPSGVASLRAPPDLPSCCSPPLAATRRSSPSRRAAAPAGVTGTDDRRPRGRRARRLRRHRRADPARRRVDQETRREVASCPGCRVAAVDAVRDPGYRHRLRRAAHLPQRGARVSRADASCARGSSSDGRPWREIGLVCLPPGGPVTVAEVGRAARARLRAGNTGASPRVPALARGPHPDACGVRLRPAGRRAHLVAGPAGPRGHPRRPRRSGRGSSATVPVGVTRRSGRTLPAPGGGARLPPGGGLSGWPARRPGRRTFVVDGLGPFPVPEPVRQTQVRRISVGEGRALLAPAHSARARPRG